MTDSLNGIINQLEQQKTAIERALTALREADGPATTALLKTMMPVPELLSAVFPVRVPEPTCIPRPFPDATLPETMLWMPALIPYTVLFKAKQSLMVLLSPTWIPSNRFDWAVTFSMKLPLLPRLIPLLKPKTVPFRIVIVDRGVPLSVMPSPEATADAANVEPVQIEGDKTGGDNDSVYARGYCQVAGQLIAARLRDYIREAAVDTVCARCGHGGLTDEHNAVLGISQAWG